MSTARAKVRGLRILIDASCLGPDRERHPGADPGPGRGARASRRRQVDRGRHATATCRATPSGCSATRKVRVIKTHGADASPTVSGPTSLHRPFQPTGGLPWMNWRRSADRVLVTLQDLIAYSVGAYHDRPKIWMNYRRGIQQAVAKADGARRDLPRRRRRPAPRAAAGRGRAHLRRRERHRPPQPATRPTAFPAELLARGLGGPDFLVVLGANYAHKNRDLAIRVYRLLREQTPVAGPGAGRRRRRRRARAGCSRPSSSRDADRRGDRCPTSPSEERNWLLRHASICLYPTSNEGFGLVPFEAARFGTPTVVHPRRPAGRGARRRTRRLRVWDPDELAACCERLLDDPQLADEQVTATLKCGSRYTWDETAARLVRAYRELLAQPAR